MLMSATPNHPTELMPVVETSASLPADILFPPISQIGNTPLIKLRKVTEHLPDSVTVYAKAEHLNPSGSVKDRTALQIIIEAFHTGALEEGKTLIDSTSGNTGISYAMIGAALGIPVEIAMPASASEERKCILRSYGAKLTLTDPDEGSDGAQRYVLEKMKLQSSDYFYANQYNNDANWRAHFEGTGAEIVDQTEGLVSHFVAGIGTTGTFVGASRRLRSFNPKVKCFSVQPDQAKHGMKGLRYLKTALVPGIYDATIADAELSCSSDEAFAMTRRLAREEGLLVGISSGANVAAAVRVAEELEEGVVVTILCDSGNRYLSQSFWA